MVKRRKSELVSHISMISPPLAEWLVSSTCSVVLTYIKLKLIMHMVIPLQFAKLQVHIYVCSYGFLHNGCDVLHGYFSYDEAFDELHIRICTYIRLLGWILFLKGVCLFYLHNSFAALILATSHFSVSVITFIVCSGF